MTELERIAAAARKAVIQAATVCRAVQAELDAVRAATKDDRSPVTVADFASQALVCLTLDEELGAEFRQLGMVAEEDANFLRSADHVQYLEATLRAAHAARPELTAEQLLDAIGRGSGEGGSGRFWTLDPIDGTKGFLRAQQYAIALGLVEDGTPTLGVVACPNLPLDPAGPVDRADPSGSLYVAWRDGGATESACLPDAPVRRTLPRCAPLARPIRVCASVEKAHSSTSATDLVIAKVGADPNVLRLDSSAKYAVVARCQADAYLRLPTRADYIERIWDHAAGVAVAREAGCVVSDIDGKTLDFAHGRGLEKNRGIVLAHPDAHPRLIEAIAAVL